MANSMMREKLRSKLLAKGIEWDDDQLDAFIESKQAQNTAVEKSLDGYRQLPSRRIVGKSEDEELIDSGTDYLKWGQPQFQPMAQQESRHGAIDFVGNLLWEAADLTTFGALGLADEKLNEGDLEQFFTGEEGPTTFAGRAGAGIGGLVGFMGPMHWAKKAAGAGVKHLSKHGTRAAGRNMMKEVQSKNMLGKSKTWNNLSKSQKENIFNPYVEALEYHAKSGMLHSAKGREAYTKLFNKDFKKQLAENLKAAKVDIRSDKKLEALEEIVMRNVGGLKGSNLPITTLQERLAYAMGGGKPAGKIANILSHTLEEAAMFAAVETPMEIFNSLEEGREADLGGTLKHAFLLGNALGAIRMIPGGKQQGITREGFRRVFGYTGANGVKTPGLLSKRRPFSQYDVAKAEDREALVKYAKSLWKAGRMGDIFKDKGLTQIDGKDIGYFAGTMDDIGAWIDPTKLAARGLTVEKGASKLKDVLMSVEKDWKRIWRQEFVKEAGQDLWGSIPRMTAGAIAFNHDIIFDDYVPLEDKIFNVLVGAYMTKKGRPVHYTAKDGTIKQLQFTEGHNRFTYGERIKDAGLYLDKLGMNHQALEFQRILKDYELKEEAFAIDKDVPDVKLLVDILREQKLIVPQDYQRKRKISKKDQATPGYNALYEHINYLADGPLTGRNERMLRADEITKSQISKLDKILADTRFENTESGVIQDKNDVDRIMQKAAEPQLKIMHDAYRQFVKEVTEKLGLDFDPAPDGSVKIWKIAPMLKKGESISDADSLTLDKYLRVVNVLGRAGGEHRVETDPRVQTVTAEQMKDIALIAESIERKINKQIYGEDVPIDGAKLGEELLNTWMEAQSYYKGVRDIHDKISDLTNESGVWGSNSEDALKAKDLIAKIFIKDGFLANKVELTQQTGSEKLELFVDGLRQVLESHPNFRSPFGLFSEGRTNIADSSKTKGKGEGFSNNDVYQLKNLFSKNGMGGFSVENQIHVEKFVDDMKNYSMDRQLSGARDVDGNLLNTVQRSKIKYMMESGIIDQNLNTINITKTIDALKAAVPSMEQIDLRMEKGEALLGEGEKVPLEGIYLGQRGLYEVVTSAAKLNNMPSAEFTKKLISNYETHVKPLMKLTEGRGVLNPSNVDAMIDAAHLSEIVSRMDMIDLKSEAATHRDLMAEIQRIRGETTGHGGTDQKFLDAVYNRFIDRSRDTRQLLNILSKEGLWNRNKNQLEMEAPKDPISAMQNAMKEMRRVIPFSDTAARVRNRINEYMSEHDMKQDFADDFRITTPNDYKENYGIEYDVIRNVFENNTTNPFGEIFKQISINDKPFDKLTKKQQRNILADTIGLFRNHLNTVNIQRMNFGEGVGTVVDNAHTMTNNELFRTVSSIVGEGNFSIVDYNYMSRAGVVDGRRNSDALINIKNMLYGSDKGVNTGLKAENDMMGMRFTPTKKSVLVSLPEASWGIAIPKDNLHELGKKFIELNKSRESTYGKDYVNAFSRLKKMSEKLKVGDKAGAERDVFQYHIDSEVAMKIDPNVIMGDGTGPREVWVAGLEAAARQLKNLQDGPIGREYNTTIDAIEGHHIIKHKKDSSKDIRIYDPAAEPVGLKLDPLKESGSDYVKTSKVKDTTYQFQMMGPVKDANYATAMLTHIWMDKAIGKNWWDVINKGNGGENPEGFAKLASRFKLMSNVSMYGMDKNLAKHALDYSRRIDGETDAVKGMQKLVDNEGMNIAIVMDEMVKYSDGREGGRLGEEIFSTYNNIKKQLEAERKANPALNGKQDTEIGDWKGLGDSSSFDSYMPVSKEIMRALELMGAAGNVEGVGGIKPIIHKYAGADGRGVILGKTVFVYSKEFDAFFNKNKDIHAIMFDSAEKMNDPSIKRYDFAANENFESLMNTKLGSEYINKLKFEDIELGAVVKPDHKATLSQQISNDLSMREGEVLFNKYVNEKLDKYNETASEIYNANDPTAAVAFAKYHNTIPETYDGMSAYSRWLKHNGIPFTTPFASTMRNNFKKVMIDDGGLLTMNTEHGGQSVLVPNLPTMSNGVSESLRNSTFSKLDGDRKVYTYGQIEIGNVNRNKPVDFNNLRFVKHNKVSKDEIISLEKLLDTNKGIVNKTMNLGQVFDAIKDTGYEIAITSYRSPRTRPGDIVISGLKGFLDSSVGNQARINAHDLKMRMEGDFDVDKVNYWWDTPQEVFNKWDNIQGAIGAVNPGKNPTSLKGLDFLELGSIEKFNKDQANGSYMRGQVVKTSRMLQFFDAYTKKTTEKGIDYKVVLNPGNGEGRVILDPDKLKSAKEILAEDIQTIVDSKNGYDKDLFREGPGGWLDTFLYGKEGTRYEGIFSWQKWDGKESRFETELGTIDSQNRANVVKGAINELMAPYKGLLQVGSGVFENGKRRSVTYDDLVDASRRFESRMRFANVNAKRKLLRSGNEAEVLAFFDKKGLKEYNPFGGIVDNVRETSLPFDRVIKEIGKHDRLKISSPSKMFGEKLEQFDRWSSEWLELGDKKIQETFNDVIKQIGKDTKNFGYLNYLDWRIRQQSNTMWEQRKNGNHDFADSIQYEVSKLTDKRTELEKAIKLEKPILKILLNQAQKRISYEITSNWKNNKYTRGKQNFTSYTDAVNWVANNQSAISGMAKKEPLRIKGMNTNAQQDMIIWNEMIGKFTDFHISPNFNKPRGQEAIDFQGDIFKFKKKYGKMWKMLFDDKARRTNKRDPWLNENMIMEQAKGMFDELYTKWESRSEGLGRLALLKLMAPTKDIGSVTYYNGKFIESFRSDSPTYIKFGLRWLANTDKIPEMLKDNMFKNFADSYNSLYKTFRGLEAPPVDAPHRAYEETVLHNRENLFEAPAPFLDYDMKFKWKESEGYDSILSEVNPDIGATFGYNPQFSTGYLLSTRTVGPEWVKYAKMASAYAYSPRGFIPQDYSGGKIPRITGWDSFNDAKYREAKLFLGDALGRNVLFAKFNPAVRGVFGEAGGLGKESVTDGRRKIEDRKKEFDKDCR